MEQSPKLITTKLPTYLETLLQESYNIKLVYEDVKKIDVYFKPQLQHSEIIKNDNTESTLDLTGTPLVTDLGGDDFTDTVTTIFEKPSSWTSVEAQYIPITLNKARSFINDHLQKKTSADSKPIYCICDGNDPKHTVILGAMMDGNKLMRTLVHILPCCDKNDEITTAPYMKKNHLANVTKTAKIHYSRRQCYYLFGYNLRNSTLPQMAENNASISVEVTTNEINKTSLNNSNYKMVLQVTVGHKDSPVYMYWEELCLLQTYIDILENIKNYSETTFISENYLNNSEITSLISDLLANVNYFKKDTSQSLNLNNLRQENILDKLWKILKFSRNLLDLSNALHYFLEELSKTQTRIHIPSENNSSLAAIVSGILESSFATLPTLTYSQCLELVIELGLEKLKNDYLVIIKNFHNFAEEIILKKWGELCCGNSSKPNDKQKTRLTINSKFAFTNLLNNKLKLFYLDCMHKVSEFMFLGETHLKRLSGPSTDHFYEAVCNKFIISVPKTRPSFDIKKANLCEFSFSLFPNDSGIIKDVSPVSWSVKMVSTLLHSEVTTIFHFSEYPIFPEAICNNYEMSLNNTDLKTIYVTKLVQFVDNC